MGRTTLIQIAAAVACLCLIGNGALAQGKKAAKKKATQSASGTDAVVGTLVDEVDGLNLVSSGHTKQIGDLKERMSKAEARIPTVASEAVEPLRTELKATKAELEDAKKEIASLKSLVGDTKKKLWWLTPDIELRIRGEYVRNYLDLESSIDDDDLRFAQRVRMGVTLEPIKGLKGVVQFQDSRLWGAEPSTATSINGVDLHQGYLLATDLFTPGFSVQAGRMQIDLGSGRQVGRSDWDNVGRAFDGIRIGYERTGTFRIDAIASLVRESGPPMGHDMNLFGVYAATTALKWLDADLYGFYLDDGTIRKVRMIGTIGARLVVRPAEGLSIEGEAAVQFGKRETQDLNGGLLEAKHLATAYYFAANYQANVVMKPSIGLFFLSASGDANPYDDRSVSYEPLFPTRHRLVGQMDLYTWQGVWDVGGSLGTAPVEGLDFGLDYHAIFLSMNGGDILGAGRYLHFPADSGKFVGHEVDLRLRWTANTYLGFDLGYSAFLPGEATRSASYMSDLGGTLTPMGSDASHFLYLQGTASF